MKVLTTQLERILVHVYVYLMLQLVTWSFAILYIYLGERQKGSTNSQLHTKLDPFAFNEIIYSCMYLYMEQC